MLPITIKGSGDGISIRGPVVSIENNGTIKIDKKSSSSIYGIHSNTLGEISDKIINNGFISIKNTDNSYAISINWQNAGIGKIINNGIMKSESNGSYQTAYGIGFQGKAQEIINNGVIDAVSKEGSSIMIEIADNSSIEKIENNGFLKNRAKRNIYGIYNQEKIGELVNKGNISVESEVYCAYGIYNYKNDKSKEVEISKIVNDGFMSSEILNGTQKCFTIFNEDSCKIGSIDNNGIISSIATKGTKSNHSNGIHNKGTIESIKNTGIIIGKIKTKDYAYAIEKASGSIKNAYNYGILTSNGEKIVEGVTLIDGKDSPEENKISNYGLAFKIGNNNYIIDLTTKAKHENVNIDDVEYTILNAVAGSANVTSTNSFTGTNYNNHILNGITDTLKVSGETNISDSMINAYTSAVVFDGENGKLTLDNVTVNGGVDIKFDEEGKITNQSSATIKGSDNSDTLNILGNSVINGNIDLGEGNDKIVIEDSAIVNGNLNGNDGDDDILLLGKERVASRFRSFFSEPKSSINILSKIEGFEIGEINADTTLFETAEIKGMEKLVINEEGKLNLRLDTTDKVGGDGKDKNNIKAGALHDTGVAISGTGTLNIVSAGLTEDDKITFGKDTTIEGDTKVEMDSAILDGDINDNIVIVVKNNNVKLSDNVARHGKLKEIYTQIVKDNLKKINEIITTAEKDKVKQVEMLSSYLNGVYAENPYSLSSEFSRKSTELMRNSILANREKAIKNEQITYGGLTHQDGSLDGSYYGMDSNKVNRYSGDIELESNLFGAYGAIEYGYFDKTSLGFVVGGSRGDSKVGSSKVDGNTIYTGLYSKTDLPYNLRLTVGTGVQHGSYDAERNYLSDNHKGNYSDTAFDIYANIKYTQMLQENLFLDYGFGMSYTYVDQDSISEENKNLAIDVDSKTFDYTDAKLDLGLRKVIGNNFGKHNLKLGASYSYMLDGADEENLRGNFKGTNSFDILVAEKEKDMFGVNIGYELEKENGFMLNANAGYNFSNSDNDEMVVGVQIGKKL